MVFATPAAKRRLFFTPMSSAKRMRTGPRTATRTFRSINRRTTRGPKTSGTLTQQVKSLQRVVRNLAPENKYLDVTTSASNITTAGSVVHITQVAQGDSQGSRTGNSINLTSISVTGRFDRAADVNSQTSVAYRIAIVIDKEQVADTSPTVSDIFTGAPIASFPNLDNLERFRILWLSPVKESKMMSMGTSNTLIPNQTIYWKFNWKGNLKVSYNGSATSDIEKNGVYICYISNDAADTIDVTSTTRIGYTDV